MWGLVFLRLGVKVSYVWGLVFLRLGEKLDVDFHKIRTCLRSCGGLYFINEIKKTCSSCIAELYKHLGIFKNTREVQRGTRLRAHITQQCTRRVFDLFTY